MAKKLEKSGKTTKSKKINKAPKVSKITTEKEFKDSLYSKKSSRYAILDINSSIICATMICECGLFAVRLQGSKGLTFKCEKCKTAYHLNEKLSVIKLTKAQKLFLKEKKQIDLE